MIVLPSALGLAEDEHLAAAVEGSTGLVAGDLLFWLVAAVVLCLVLPSLVLRRLDPREHQCPD
jgi:hypothetical protein